MNLFNPLKTWYFQPNQDMCVSAAIKTAWDNQCFKKQISIRQINKLCKYEGVYGEGICLDLVDDNVSPEFNKKGVLWNVQENANVAFLVKLLEAGHYPIVAFDLSAYHSWSNRTDREVSPDGTSLHVLIVVGVDLEEEVIFVFDTIHNKYRNYTDETERYDKIPISKFLNCWTKKEMNYPCFWLSPLSSRKKKLHQSQKRLEGY